MTSSRLLSPTRGPLLRSSSVLTSRRLSQVQSHLTGSPAMSPPSIAVALASNGGGATQANPLILYDIVSTNQPMAWSPNVWKTRLVLNYKKIPYKTEWLCYMDIKETLKQLGFGPSAVSRDGTEHYTLPAISDPSINPEEGPTLLVDSPVIAEYLDTKYPSNPLFPAGSKASISLFIKYTQTNLLVHLIQLVVPLVHGILDERGAEYFHRTRKPIFGGKDLKDVGVDREERQAVWNKLNKELDNLAGHYAKSGGPFWMGSEVTYPDLLVGALFSWMRSVKCDGNRDPEFETPWDVIKDRNNGRWAALMEHIDAYTQCD